MEEIIPLLRELAAQMGTTVEFLWEVLVKQAFVSGIGQIILYVILLVCVYVSIRYLFPYLKNKYDESDESDPDEVFSSIGMVMLGILLIPAVIVAILEIPNLITKFVNPEYWALQQILEYIK